MRTMKIMNKCIKIIDKLINFIITIFFIMVLFFGSYALYDAYYIYDRARLTDELLELRPLDEEAEFSLETLQAINEDICGWIRINGTKIDYPILIGKDNEEYLNIDYKKEYATAGSIFLDYKNDRHFNDDYSIIYGHNMEADLMFADIKKYDDEEYFKEHTLGTLYTDSGIYNVEIFCLSNVDAYSSQSYYVEMYRNGYTTSLVRNFKTHAILERDIEIDPKDKLLLLSTCDAIGSNDRLVLLAKLTKKDGSQIINEGNTAELKRIENEKAELQKTESQERLVLPTETIHQEFRKIPVRIVTLIFLSIIVVIIFVILAIKIIKSGKGKHSLDSRDK